MTKLVRILMNKTKWTHFPKDLPPHPIAEEIIKLFETRSNDIDSSIYGQSGSIADATKFTSDFVLDTVFKNEEQIPGLKVEKYSKSPGNKKDRKKIKVVSLYGDNGEIVKSYEPDGYHKKEKLMLEVEGRMTKPNNVGLKDLFKACTTPEVDHFVLAVPVVWKEKNGKISYPYEYVKKQFTEIHESRKFDLPLKTLTLIGY
jgi:hypothetical protein